MLPLYFIQLQNSSCPSFFPHSLATGQLARLFVSTTTRRTRRASSLICSTFVCATVYFWVLKKFASR